jgi:hypothetical protein
MSGATLLGVARAILTGEPRRREMGFNPLSERGIPMEKQTKNWSELNMKGYDKRAVHPYTRCRIILMNGIEVESAMFGHQFARAVDDPDLKRQLAQVRRVEQAQQKAVNWMIPGDESPLELTIGYEQVAVDLTAVCARRERDPYVKQAFDFGLLEDFDHLYRYANLLQRTENRSAGEITRELTEITVGRPTSAEHRHPFDDVRRHFDATTVDPVTCLNVMTVLAGEQQTMNFYMTQGSFQKDAVGRGLYLEIAQIEEQHVTHYESLLDPRMSWLQRLVWHEYHEAFMYNSCAQSEVDPNIRKIWEHHLQVEIQHLHNAVELYKKYERRDPQEFLPREFPSPIVLEPNVDYVRGILASQVDWNTCLDEFLPNDRMPKDARDRYEHYQRAVNNGGVPSEQIIDMQRKAGKEYRSELKGPNPVERFRR